MSRIQFLDNVRIARNLVENARTSAQARHLDQAAATQTLVRAGIWLTPSSVKGFRAEEFPELGPLKQRELAEAVRDFERLARQVPSDEAAESQRFTEGEAVLKKMLAIVALYLPEDEDAPRVRAALATIDLAPWVLNWDYELGSDQADVPAVWVTLYADEKSLPFDQLGKYSLEMSSKLRSALKAVGVRRWPYISLRTAAEYRDR